MKLLPIVVVISLLANLLGGCQQGRNREPTSLTPASPQPDRAALLPGLGVKYAYPSDVQWLADAARALNGTVVQGPSLAGLSYGDTSKGQTVLTSQRAEYVAVEIDGFMYFDKPGIYELGFKSNDGLAVYLAGREVYRHDGRHGCESKGWEEVSVPSEGWYALSATFFQRLNTACLLLEWKAPDGVKAWVPNEVFAHLPK